MELDDRRLCACIDKEHWDELLSVLKPKFFPRDAAGKLIDPRILAKVAETLTNATSDTPDKVKIVLLKCLMNSCVHGYVYRDYDIAKKSVSVDGNEYYTVLYEIYSTSVDERSTNNNDYPITTHFSYGGVAKWAVDYITEYSFDRKNLSDDDLEILRLSIQFLCNLCTFACKNRNFPEYEKPPSCIEDSRFKEAMCTLVRHDHVPVSRAACAHVHNILTQYPENYYSPEVKNRLTVFLIKPVKSGIKAATDALAFLLKQSPKRLRSVYEEIQMDDRLYLLEMFHQKLRETASQEEAMDSLVDFSPDSVEFLSESFRKKSDLILKTVESYVDGTEPTEIMILLDVIGALTARTSSGGSFENLLKNDKSLLINCAYLLKSLHMVGRESTNHFTPVQKLSELAPSTQNKDASGKDDIQSHPAFGFKAGLVRVIGNMAHKSKENQDLLRETDTIPLLLDCCNMDARNPLIMQWTILAMRNIVENNSQNQEIVRNLTKVGVVDSAILHEMGLTLHEEDGGKTIGVMPLNRDK